METDARIAAERYYSGSARSLTADIAALSQTGIVIYMPRLVALLKPVQSCESSHWEDLSDQPRCADAWYVHLLAGDIAWARKLAQSLPPLPWLCYRRGLRNARPHVLSWRRFLT